MMFSRAVLYHGRAFTKYTHLSFPQHAGGGVRSFSAVVNLSDEKAVEKFRMINQKSVLYFTANWCGPCKMIKPLYEDLSKKHTVIAFGKIDIDENDAAAVKYEISGVPTFILFDGETAVERFTGADSNKLDKSIQELGKR